MRRCQAPSGSPSCSYTTTWVGVRAPVRSAANRLPAHDSCPCTPRPTSCTSPESIAATHSRPNPASLRVKATYCPSGDQQYDRWPRPQVGPACSNCSSASGASSTHTLFHPRSSCTAMPRPSGSTRGCCMLCGGTNSSWTAPSKVRRTVRARSHGMSGTFHASHTTPVPHGIGHGSKQKSAEPSSRRCAPAPSAPMLHTSAWSTTYTSRVPSGTATGACAARSGPWSVRRRDSPPSSGCHHRLPSTPAYTTAVPSADQHQQPPPRPRPDRGATAPLSALTLPSSRPCATNAATPSDATTTTMRVPSGCSRGSVRSRPPRHRSTGIAPTPRMVATAHTPGAWSPPHRRDEQSAHRLRRLLIAGPSARGWRGYGGR